MNPTVKRAGRLGALVIVAGAALLAYRHAKHGTLAPVDASAILSPVQAEDGGTEPVALPTTPVLKNDAKDAGQVAFDFGYTLAGTTYAYRLGLTFAPESDKGTMDLGVLGHASARLDQSPIERRWSDTRKGYLVAVSRDLTKLTPPVPSLCVRAVVGPSKASLDLKEASLCVMQRDDTGRCHPTTLACGLIR